MKLSLKDALFTPIYLYQGKKLKRTALRLPEAEGERYGNMPLTQDHIQAELRVPLKDNTLNLMIVGDSSAAGVGVSSQQNALVGHLLTHIKTSEILQSKFSAIKWSLHATSGHTSFDVLRRLYILPKPTSYIDIMVIVVGVNDTTGRVSLHQWQNKLENIIAVAQRKFGTKDIIFSRLPPMAQMPAIPIPLNRFIGAQSDIMDQKLKEVCIAHDSVYYLDIDFAMTNLDNASLFAKDGFHPSSIAYQYWAKELNSMIEKITKQVS